VPPTAEYLFLQSIGQPTSAFPLSVQIPMNRFNLLIGGVALAGAGVLIYLVAGKKATSIPANVTVQAADTAGFRGYIIGSADAPIEVTEYADYQCPSCAGFETVQWPDIKSRLVDAGRLKWRYRDFPLDQHPHARVAAHAAACADEQGKFGAMKMAIYEAQSTWSPKADASGDFRDMAKAIGADADGYDACMSSAKFAGRIQASRDEAMAVGVSSTPSVMVNGRLYPGGINYDDLRALVDSLAPAAAPAATTK